MRADANDSFIAKLTAFDLSRTTTANVWPLAIAVAWSFDLLFWRKQPGISFPIFVAVVAACGYAVMRSTSAPVATSAKWLVLPLAFFASASAIRAEPLTVALDYLATLGLICLLADTLTEGGWIRYRLADYFVAFFHLGLGVLMRGALDLSERRGGTEARDTPPRRRESVLRGILLSLPLLIVFGLLFASADKVFSRLVGLSFGDLVFADFMEYAFRILYIALLAYGLAGLFLHAIVNRAREESPFHAPPRRGMGFMEGSIVLGSLNALFGLFAVIQFRYLFAGSTAVTEIGMTYSEYARRGFGELVAVAILTLVVLVGLGLIVDRQSTSQKRIFSALSSGIVILTSVILISAFQRLFLYEDAYGYTRLRMYSHVFMVWLGLLLVAVLVLEWKDSLRSLAFAFLLAGLGFTASLNILGVDGLIAENNIERAERGAEFDAFYLSGLSTDAIPAIVAGAGHLSEKDRSALSGILACGVVNEQRSWQSIHLSRERARRALMSYSKALKEKGQLLPGCGAGVR